MESSTFGLEIYAANRRFFAGRAKSLIIPAEDGQKEFLAHHVDMICAIVPGEMRFEDSEGNWQTVAVSSGFVEMINNRAKLFCLTVERPEEIDTRRAEEARAPGRGAASPEAEYCGISQKSDGTCKSYDKTSCYKRSEIISESKV